MWKSEYLVSHFSPTFMWFLELTWGYQACKTSFFTWNPGSCASDLTWLPVPQVKTQPLDTVPWKWSQDPAPFLHQQHWLLPSSEGTLFYLQGYHSFLPFPLPFPILSLFKTFFFLHTKSSQFKTYRVLWMLWSVTSHVILGVGGITHLSRVTFLFSVYIVSFWGYRYWLIYHCVFKIY